MKKVEYKGRTYLMIDTPSGRKFYNEYQQSAHRGAPPWQKNAREQTYRRLLKPGKMRDAVGLQFEMKGLT